MGANTARRVRLFNRTIAIGKGRSMVRFTPTTEMVPPGAAHDTASTMVASAPTASITLSAPRPPVASRTWSAPGADAGVDGLRPEALGAGQALGHHVHGEDARRPEERRGLQRHDPDGAEAHDDHGGARLDGGAQRTQVARREDVGEEDRLLVGDALGDGEGEEVGEGHGHGLGLAARQVGQRPEGGVLVGEADVGLAGQAGRADAAPDHARDQDAVTPLQAADVWPHFRHRPDGLVTELNAGPGGRVVVQVQIGSADGGALDRHDDAFGTGQDRIGDVLDRDVARSLQDGGSHLRTLPRRTTLSRA